MGVSIESKSHNCDLGFAGFNRFRNLVAEKISIEFGEHYKLLTTPEVLNLYGEEHKKFYAEYDAKTNEFIKNGVVPLDVAIFLYKSDCEGKINKQQAKKVYELIKDCDDNIVYGYIGRSDCATMKDFKQIFGNGSTVKWY